MPFVRITVHIRPDENVHRDDTRVNVGDEFTVEDGFDGEWEAFERAGNAVVQAQKRYKEVQHKRNNP